MEFQILAFVASFLLGLGSQGIFAEHFNWLQWLLVMVISYPVFCFASRFPPALGAVLYALMALISIAHLKWDLFSNQPALNWVFAVFASSYMALELQQPRPSKPLVIICFFVALGSTFLFHGLSVLFAFFLFAFFSLFSIPKNLNFPRATSQVLLFGVLIAPMALWLGPKLNDLINSYTK